MDPKKDLKDDGTDPNKKASRKSVMVAMGAETRGVCVPGICRSCAGFRADFLLSDCASTVC